MSALSVRACSGLIRLQAYDMSLLFESPESLDNIRSNFSEREVVRKVISTIVMTNKYS